MTAMRARAIKKGQARAIQLTQAPRTPINSYQDLFTFTFASTSTLEHPPLSASRPPRYRRRRTLRAVRCATPPTALRHDVRIMRKLVVAHMPSLGSGLGFRFGFGLGIVRDYGSPCALSGRGGGGRTVRGVAARMAAWRGSAAAELRPRRMCDGQGWTVCIHL